MQVGRRFVAVTVSLIALASIVFAGSNGLPVLSVSQPDEQTERPSISGNTTPTKKRDYVNMKSDEGWQMDYNGRKIMVVVGNFAAHHNGTVITADSAVRYSERHIECFGNVLINKGTTYIYGDRAEYNGNTNEAKVFSRIVKVVDGDATLYTYNFTFNTKTNVGYYMDGGVFVSGDNMMESDRGYLYSDDNQLICVERVQMRNKEYDMLGDSVVYNTETEYAQFFTNTNIWNKDPKKNFVDHDYLYADRGSFDKKLQLYTLTRNGYILTTDHEMLCDTMDYYRDSGYVRLKRNFQIDDTSQKMLIFGDWGEYWKEPGNVFVTRNPSLISYDTSEGDTVFMSSDTMYVYTRYPIREKIEQARKDSIAKAEKMLADSLAKDSLAKANPKSENVAAVADRGDAKQDTRKERPNGKKERAASKSAERKERREERENQRDLSAPHRDVAEAKISGDQPLVASADSLGAKADSVALKSAPKSDSIGVVKGDSLTRINRDSLRRAKRAAKKQVVDSLLSPRAKIRLLTRLDMERAQRIKVEVTATNRAVKEAIKRDKAERAKLLQTRNKLRALVLGEARVRDAIRAKELKRIKDSIKRVQKLMKDSLANDSLKMDSLKLDSLKRDSLKLDSLKRDSLKLDSLKRDSVKLALAKQDSIKQDSLRRIAMKSDSLKVDSLKRDSLKVDSLAKDSTKVDSLAKFAKMTAKEVVAHFKELRKVELEQYRSICQDSLNAELDRIALVRQAQRTVVYKRWERYDSLAAANAQMRSDARLRRKLQRMERRGIYLEMADSATLRSIDSLLKAEFGPLDERVVRLLDSLIAIYYPQEELTPTEMMKKDSMNIDSLYRNIIALSRVKMFRTDFQTVCDSLAMTTIDSIIHLHKSPILWNGANQILSEIMHITTRNSTIAKAEFEGKPLTISQIDTAHYNQVAGKEMSSLFEKGEMYRNDVNGNVQTIYYMQEDNSPDITLMAYIEAGDMTSYIKDKQVVGITYRGSPVYTFYPMDKIPETQPKKLDGFVWAEDRRPARDSVFTRTIHPSTRLEKRALRRPLFPINAIMQQRRSDYIRRKEWVDRADTLTVETLEWLESIKTDY